MALVATGSAAMEPTQARAQLTSEQTTLPNGLTVVSAQRPDAETVALTLTARAGARFEDPSTDSSARFLERMYQQGTPGRPSRDAIMQTVTSRGGLFSVGTGWEFMDFSLVMAPATRPTCSSRSTPTATPARARGATRSPPAGGQRSPGWTPC